MNASEPPTGPVGRTADDALRGRLREPVAAWVESRPRGGEHLGVDELTDYLLGRVAGERQEAIRDHLEGCPACVELSLDLGTFLQPAAQPPRGGAFGDLEMEASWRSLRSALRRQQRAERWRPRWTRRQLVAAALSLAVVGAGTWSLGQRHGAATAVQAPEARPQPEAGGAAVDLSPASVERGGGMQAPAARVSESEYTWLIIHLPVDALPYEVYACELRTPGHDLVWSSELGAAGDLGQLSVRLPKRSLAPGKYSLLVFGLEGEERHWVETYPLDVVPH